MLLIILVHVKSNMDVTTALTLVIPDEFHEMINSVRKEHDRAYPRWMPHINFIFPFVPEEQFDMMVAKLDTVLRGFGSFTLNLDTVGYFKQGKGVTIHLKPSDKSHLEKLFDQIKNALPDVEIKHAEFNPHMTLAQCKKSNADALVAELQDKFKDGISFEVEYVSILARSKTVPFSVVKQVKIN